MLKTPHPSAYGCHLPPLGKANTKISFIQIAETLFFSGFFLHAEII